MKISMLFAASVVEIRVNNKMVEIENLTVLKVCFHGLFQTLALYQSKIVNQFSFKKFGAKFSRGSIDSQECVKPA